MEAWIGNDQGLYILFYIFFAQQTWPLMRKLNILKEEIYMIEVMTKNYEVRLRKENYDGFTVTSPNGINTPFWTALTEVLEVEPWAEAITIKENSIISAGDLDK